MHRIDPTIILVATAAQVADVPQPGVNHSPPRSSVPPETIEADLLGLLNSMIPCIPDLLLNRTASVRALEVSGAESLLRIEIKHRPGLFMVNRAFEKDNRDANIQCNPWPLAGTILSGACIIGSLDPLSNEVRVAFLKPGSSYFIHENHPHFCLFLTPEVHSVCVRPYPSSHDGYSGRAEVRFLDTAQRDDLLVHLTLIFCTSANEGHISFPSSCRPMILGPADPLHYLDLAFDTEDEGGYRETPRCAHLHFTDEHRELEEARLERERLIGYAEFVAIDFGDHPDRILDTP